MAKWASKDRAITGLKFIDKYGIEYEFNKEEDAIIKKRPIDVAPFPDVQADAPGIMTQYENLINGEDVIEGKPVSNDEEQAMLVAKNSGLEIRSTNKLRAAGDLIKLLDDDKVDKLDDNIRHDKEVKMKEEPQQAKITDQDEEDHNEDHANETGMEQPRRLGREQACPKQFEDYKVYVTIEEEDTFMLTTCADDDVVSTDKNNDKALEAVVHYIVMHYEEKEKLKKRKKKYKPKDGQYSLDARLCHFGDRVEMAVTKELHQFNTYEVFKPIVADSLSAEEKKKAPSLLIFLKEKQKRYCEGTILRERKCTTIPSCKGRGGISNGGSRVCIRDEHHCRKREQSHDDRHPRSVSSRQEQRLHYTNERDTSQAYDKDGP